MKAVGKAVRALQDGGLPGAASAARRWLRRALGPQAEDVSFSFDDAFDGTLDRPRTFAEVGSRLTVAWVLTPPAGGSGGHTTIFRMIEALERRGHHCLVWLYPGRGTVDPGVEGTIRSWWPRVRAQISPIPDDAGGVHAVVATAWQTAHVVAGMRGAAQRLYFVQDYEPWFYGQGTVSELARATYGFGFETVTVGSAIARQLVLDHGIEATVVPYGCDHGAYWVDEAAPRDSVVFYSRPGVPRRGYDLGIRALEVFHTLRPNVPIHVLGPVVGRLTFPATVHRALKPNQLNELYSRCLAGLVLSFTNVSLVPFELLAAGVVPVLNDWPLSRLDLDGNHVLWGSPLPQKMAQALAAGVDKQAAVGPRAVAAAVGALDWMSSGEVFVRAVEATCYGRIRTPVQEGTGLGSPFGREKEP